jgi:hypothetical protein
MSNELVAYTVSDVKVMAEAAAKSGLFGMKTPEQALALMMLCQAEGIHPMKAVAEYHIIQGRPALKADAMLTRFLRAGGTVKWNRLDDKEVSATFTHPQTGEVTINWTMEMAKNAGLSGKDTWKQYPRQMLRSRVISEGVRTMYPGVADGIYTPEEVQDFDTKPPTSPKGKEGLKAALVDAPEPVSVQIVEAPNPPVKQETISEAQYNEIISALKESTKDCDADGKKEVMAEGLRLFNVKSLRNIRAESFKEALAWAKGEIPVFESAEDS